MAVDVRCQLSVSDARAEGDGTGRIVDRHLVQMLEGNLLGRAVRDRIKGMARAQGANLAGTLHDGLGILHGGRCIETVGAVSVVAGPVRSCCLRPTSVVRRLPGCVRVGCKTSKHSACQCQARGLEEFSLVQVCCLRVSSDTKTGIEANEAGCKSTGDYPVRKARPVATTLRSLPAATYA